MYIIEYNCRMKKLILYNVHNEYKIFVQFKKICVTWAYSWWKELGCKLLHIHL